MNKKIKIGIIAAAGVAVVGVGIFFGVRKMSDTKVDVYAVSDILQQPWMDNATLDGMVTSSVSQEVHLVDKQVVDQVFVQEGQEVVEGTPLLSYDMTLTNLDLEMEKINKQQLEIKKKGLEKEIENLKKKKVTETASGDKEYAVVPLSVAGEGNAEAKDVQKPEKNAKIGELDMDNLEEEGSTGSGTGKTDGSENQDTSGKTDNPDNTNPDKPNPDDTNPDKPNPDEPNPDKPNPDDTNPDNPTPDEPNPDTPDPEQPETPKPSYVYDRLYGDITLETNPGESRIENAIPVEGTGTKEDPFVYLCKTDVKIQGAFLNQLAGFGEGDTKEKDPAFCLLEVRTEVTPDKETEKGEEGEPEAKTDGSQTGDESKDKKGVLLAALLIDGSKIEEKYDPAKWFLTHLGVYTQEEEPLPPDENEMELPPEIFDELSQGDITDSYTKEERDKAIAEKKKDLKGIALDIKESNLKIQSVEKKLENQTVKSTLNGKVKKVGDPEKGEIDGEAFIVVESTEGSYIKGTVSEYLLDKVKPGTTVNGFAYESGLPIEAEIKEVSNFPDSSNRYGGYGVAQSYYPFTAYVKNSDGLKNMEGVSLNVEADMEGTTGIYLSNQFIRSSDGQDYVFVEDKNHRLKKQIVHTGKNFYGMMVEIKDGITMEDSIAFPYGKKVKEGARVRKGSMEELYNMY